MARAIEDVGLRLGLGRRPPPLPLARTGRPRGPWEAWTLLAALAASTSADRARAARRLHELPHPGAARQAGRDGRRDQRRPARPRPRRRLERDRVPRLRLPVRPPDRPLRGGVHDHPDAPARGRDRLRRALVPGPRLRAPAARPAAGRAAADDRLDRPADAPRRRWPTSTPGTPGTTTPATGRTGVAPLRDRSMPPAATSAATRPRSSGPSPCSSGCPAAPAGSRATAGKRADRRRSTATRPSIADALRAFARAGIGHVQLVARPDHRSTRSRRSRRSSPTSTRGD